MINCLQYEIYEGLKAQSTSGRKRNLVDKCCGRFNLILVRNVGLIREYIYGRAALLLGYKLRKFLKIFVLIYVGRRENRLSTTEAQTVVKIKSNDTQS